jgi:hypothetical protein
VAQSADRIDRKRAQCRNQNSDKRHHEQQERYTGENQWIDRANLVELALQQHGSERRPHPRRPPLPFQLAMLPLLRPALECGRCGRQRLSERQFRACAVPLRTRSPRRSRSPREGQRGQRRPSKVIWRTGDRPLNDRQFLPSFECRRRAGLCQLLGLAHGPRWRVSADRQPSVPQAS